MQHSKGVRDAKVHGNAIEKRINDGNNRCGKRVGRIVAAILGVIAGFVNAIFGGGGGMLVVPAMQYCLGVEERKAHASAIAVILPLSIVSAIVFAMRGTYDLTTGIAVSCGATVGGVIGALLLRKVPKAVLSILFYGVMIYVGVRYLV